MSLKSTPIHELTLQDPAVFGPKANDQTLAFVQRAFCVPEVLAIVLNREQGEARLVYQRGPNGQKATLTSIAAAIGAPDSDSKSIPLPALTPSRTCALARHPGGIALVSFEPAPEGHLVLSSNLFRAEGERLGLWLCHQLQSVAGVRGVALDEAEGTLEIAFNPRWIDDATLLRIFFQRLPSARSVAPKTAAEPVPMGVSGASVGLSTVGELLVPVATPLAAGVLVATNIHIVKEAANQLGRGKVGVPLFHTALLACSLATGQVLAFALTDLSLRYWQRRWRRQLADETEKTIDLSVPATRPFQRVVQDSSLEAIDYNELVPGDLVRLRDGDWLPFDGRIIKGQALVDERLALGAPRPILKGPQEEIWSGSGLVAGEIEVRIERVGAMTRLASMGLRLSESSALIASTPMLQEKAGALGDKTALPTLAAAGVGWLAGNLITVGAILHQDWVSGPYLAVPLVTLKHLRTALSLGALIQTPVALPKMAHCQFLILDGDDPALEQQGLDLVSFDTVSQNPESLLRHIAGVALFLGDQRTNALLETCAARGIVIRPPDQVGIETHSLTAQLSDHQLQLISDPEEGVKALIVKVDGQEIAQLRFKDNGIPIATAAVQRIKAHGTEVFLMSSRPEKDTQLLAKRLGIDLYGADLDEAGKRRFLEGLRKRGVKAGFAGVLSNCPGWMELIDLPIAVEPVGEAPHCADVVLAGQGYAALADLFDLARGFEPEVVKSTREALVPNLLCVAGAFGGVLNGITSGIIANVGVLNVDRSLRKGLKDAPPYPSGHPLLKNRQGPSY